MHRFPTTSSGIAHEWMGPGTDRSPEFERRARLGRYELLGEIARGGMATVLLARVEGVGGFSRLVAIKVLHPHLAVEGEFAAMFLDEARLAARIHNPHVVAIDDVCRGAGGYYLVMDYVEGPTLARLLAHAGLSPRERVRVTSRVILDALAGLGAAHGATDDDGRPLEIVHRDVSPQNVLVGVDGVARITDFGIARAASRLHLSRPGILRGKPAYMAPEQVLGRAVDHRTDLFAAGVVLWECLTNRRLFEGATEAALLLDVLHCEVVPPSRLAHPSTPEVAALDAVCLRALERDPDRRFGSALEMALALEHAAGPADALATPAEVADVVRRLFGEDLRAWRRGVLGRVRTPPRGHRPGRGAAGGDDPIALPVRPSRVPAVLSALALLGGLGIAWPRVRPPAPRAVTAPASTHAEPQRRPLPQAPPPTPVLVTAPAPEHRDAGGTPAQVGGGPQVERSRPSPPWQAPHPARPPATRQVAAPTPEIEANPYLAR